MRNVLILCLLALLLSGCDNGLQDTQARPAPPSLWEKNGSDSIAPRNGMSITLGDPNSTTGVEETVLEHTATVNGSDETVFALTEELSATGSIMRVYAMDDSGDYAEVMEFADGGGVEFDGNVAIGIEDHKITRNGDDMMFYDTNNPDGITLSTLNEEITAIEITLTENQIMVGNASNQATGVAMSGDATIASSGALTIASDAVENAMMADNSVDSDEYVDGSIDAEHLAADVIDETKIADDGIDSEHYNDGSIDEEHLNIANAPTDEYVLTYESDTSNFQWAELSGGGDITTVGECTTGDCTTDFINGSDIVDDSIDSEHYAAGSIDNEHLNTTQDWSTFTLTLPSSIDFPADSVLPADLDQDGNYTSLTGNWATTGELTGALKIDNDSDGYSVSGAMLYGGFLVETGNQQTVTLGSVAAGMSFCVLADGADGSAEVYLDCDASDHFEYDGTTMADGEYIYNDSDLKGDRMCVVGISNDTWIVTYGGDTTVAEETP